MGPGRRWRDPRRTIWESAAPGTAPMDSADTASVALLALVLLAALMLSARS
ncbi:hypothetical protein LBMAG39_13930 [Cyanobium sp.]|nr:hypothetical protein LBMAG39_13930 [Cyanobium sp.]